MVSVKNKKKNILLEYLFLSVRVRWFHTVLPGNDKDK